MVVRTVLYRDDEPFRPARAEVLLEPEALVLIMPDGHVRRHALDGVCASTGDGCVAQPGARGSSEQLAAAARAPHPSAPRVLRRFVRMLVLDRGGDRAVVITPPDLGAVAPGVVHVPAAPHDAAVVDPGAWEALADWLQCGGRLSACSISDLARLACIASSPFAALIGEVSAQRALEQASVGAGPLRGGSDLDAALRPLVAAARQSPRASEALVSALAHAAGHARRRRRAPRG